MAGPTLYVTVGGDGEGRAALYRGGLLAEHRDISFGPPAEEYDGRPCMPSWSVHHLLRSLATDYEAFTRVRFEPLDAGSPAFPAPGEGWPEDESSVPAAAFPHAASYRGPV